MRADGTFYIRTFGCQMNERDSEIAASLLGDLGLRRVAGVQEAQVVVVNTCHIREHAEGRALSFVGRLKGWRAECSSRVLVLMGCVAEAHSSRLLNKFPQVDLVLGPSHLLALGDAVGKAMNNGGKAILTGIPREAGVPELKGSGPRGWKASIKIMEGCDQRCAFCVVPLVRGPARDGPFEGILAEASRLADEGVVELLLLGSAVNAYGRRAGPERDFAALIRGLSLVRGLERVRFMSPHPLWATPAMFEAMADSSNAARHLHLPVQSGSNRMLKAMRRGYTSESFLGQVSAARRLMPNLSITSDFIVGFPGETQEDFRDSLKLAVDAGFDGAFTFKYSARPGTPAASFDGQVPEEVKNERLAEINSTIGAQGRRVNDKLVGSTVEVLVEGPSEKNCAWLGRLGSNKAVFFERGDARPGQLRLVELTKAGSWTLSGKLKAPAGEARI